MNKRQHKKVVDKYERSAKRRKTVAILSAGLNLLSIGMKMRTSDSVNLFMYNGSYAAAQIHLHNVMAQSTSYAMRPNRPGVKYIKISSNPTK